MNTFPSFLLGLAAIVATTNCDIAPEKIIESHTKELCPKGYEYNTQRRLCLSLSQCWTQDCPRGAVDHGGDAYGCWTETCEDTRDPCLELCVRKEICSSQDGCEEIVSCHNSCEDGSHEKRNSVEDEEYYDYGPEVLPRDKRQAPESCPNGTVFCSRLGRCEQNCTTQSPIVQCSPGEQYCMEERMCLVQCVERSPTEDIFECDSGKLFCVESMECLFQCSEVDANEELIQCPEGTSYCLKTATCTMDCGSEPEEVLDRHPEAHPCPPGTEFCMSSGSCVPNCDPLSEGPSSPATEKVCPPGTFLCLKTNACSMACSNSEEAGNGLECPPGTHLCMEQGSCQVECDQINRERNSPTTDMACPPGTSLCLESRSCTMDCRKAENGTENVKANMTCPLGTGFCFQTGSCQTDCEGLMLKPTDGDCPSGTFLCSGANMCSKDCGGPVDINNPNNTLVCPPGTRFCITSGLCEVGCDPIDRDSTPPGTKCPIGTNFCLDTRLCSITCLEGESGYAGANLTCPLGTTYCLKTASCQLECEGPTSKPSQSGSNVACPPGTFLCLETNMCSLDCADPENIQDPTQPHTFMCPPGAHFCIDSGSCQADCSYSIDPGPSPSRINANCPSGTAYCLQTGTCQLDCDASPSKPTNLKWKCSPGTFFCLETQRCAVDCTKYDDSHGPNHLDIAVCPPGTQFCMTSRSCQVECEAIPPDSSLSSGQQCPAGTWRCLENELCSMDCRQTGTNQTTVCDSGLVFCSNSGRCQSNCFDLNDTSNDPVGLGLSFTNPCSLGTVFCLSSGQCDTNCSAPNAVCPVGLLFCNNSNSCGRSCPRLGANGTLECPTNEIYCSSSKTCEETCIDSPNEPNVNNNGTNGPCPSGTVLCGTGICSKKCDEVQEQSCPQGTTFCNGTRRCQAKCTQNDEESSTQCPDGTVFCINQGMCLSQCSPIDPKVEFIRCPPDTIYCLEEGECLDNCHGDQTWEPTTVCPLGTAYCLDHGECRRECDEWDELPTTRLDHTICPSGTSMCLEQMRCLPDCEEQSPTGPLADTIACPSETLLCLESGTCEPDCSNTLESHGKNCPRGTHFCFESGRCSTQCESPSHREPIHLDVDYVCPPGTAFCLDSNSCSNECNDGPLAATIEMHCPPATSFCMNTKQCMPDCDRGPSVPTPIPDLFHCPQGTMFCLKTQECSTECRTDKNLVGLEPGWAGRHPFYTICPRGYVYCMSIDACVLGDCSVFDSQAPTCNSGEILDALTQKCIPQRRVGEKNSTQSACNGEKVYCPSRDDCLSPGDQCQPGTSCPWGTILCKGKCSQTCFFDDVGCPDPELLSEVGFSSCRINRHCELGYLCCHDQGGVHRQCVHQNASITSGTPPLEVTPPIKALNQSCRALGRSRASFLNLDREFCSASNTGLDDPSLCRANTLCCDGACWGLPSMNWTSVGDNDVGPSQGDCRGRDMYCPLIEACLPLRRWSECSKSCPKDQQLCEMGSKALECSSNCSDNRVLSQIWLSPLVQNPDSTQAESRSFRLRDLFDEYLPERDQSSPASRNHKAVVMEADPGWEFQGEPTWQKLVQTSQLDLDTQVRYQGQTRVKRASENITRQQARFKVKVQDALAGTDQFITVAQLRLPALTSLPVLAGNSNTSDAVEQGDQDKVEVLRYAIKEDNREPVLVSDVFKVIEDPEATGILRREYQRLYDEMQVEGIWRLNVPKTDSLVGRFLETFNHGEGRVQRPLGVKLEFSPPILRKEDYRNKILYSTNAGNDWTIMDNPQKPLYLPLNQDTLMLVDLEKDYVGPIAFNVTAYVQDLDGSIRENQEEKQTIILEVEPVNDAPRPIFKWQSNSTLNFPLVPYNLTQSDNRGFQVQELTGMFYDGEPSDQGLGLAILHVQSSQIGRWQGMVGNGTSGASEWEDIRVDGNLLIPEGLISEYGYRGPLPVSVYMQKLACDLDDTASSLTTPDEARCWNKIRQEACPAQTVSGTLQKWSTPQVQGSQSRSTLASEAVSQALEKITRATQGSEDVSKPQRQKLTASLQTRRVSALLLGPDVRIRFEPFKPESAWTKTDAIKATRLVFTAWDGSDGRQSRDQLGLSMPFCCDGNCDKNSSLARDFSVIYMEKEDCDGKPVLHTLRKVDDCGVCGGENTCRDCTGIINGGSLVDCGQCVGNGTLVRDCSGKCLVQSQPSAGQACVPTTNRTDPSGISCDGIEGSQAQVNVCGFCGTDPSAGLNECGACGPKSTHGCQCGEEYDDCSQCRMPQSPEFSVCTGTEIPLEISPDSYDLIRSDKVFVSLSHPLIPAVNLKKSDTQVDCYYILNDVQLPLGITKVKKSKIRGWLFNPIPGLYHFKCSIQVPDEPITLIESASQEKMTIVQSDSISVEDVYTEEGPEGQLQLYIGVNRPLAAFEEPGLTCFCRRIGSQKSQAMTETQLDSVSRSLVHCGELSVPAGDRYQCGVILRPEKKILRRPTLPSMEITFDQEAPQVKTVKVQPNRGLIILQFDMNVEGPQECAQIFTLETLSLLAGNDNESVECRLKTNRLRIQLESQARIKELRGRESFPLKFLEGNAIRARGGNIEYSDELSSDRVVMVKREKVEDDEDGADTKQDPSARGFSWAVPNSICFGTNLRARARSLRSFGQVGDKLEYFITDEINSSREGRANESVVVLKGTLVIGPSDDKERDPDLATTTTTSSARPTEADAEDSQEDGAKAKLKNQGERKKRSGRSKKKEWIKLRKDKLVVSIPTETLQSGVPYRLDLKPVPKDEKASESIERFQSMFTMANEDQAHIVNIQGQNQILPDRKAILRARIKTCRKGQEVEVAEDASDESAKEPQEPWKFLWSTDGQINFNLANKDLKRLQIPKHGLEGGRSYTFVVQVVPELNPEAAFQSQLTLEVTALGLKAQFAASELTFGMQNEIRLDGSLSKDLDNKEAAMRYEWFCVKSSNFEPCQALQMGNEGERPTQLLKTQYSTEMKSRILTLPRQSLAIGGYTFKLCVHKDTRSDCANISVTIRAGKVATIQLAALDSVANPEEETIIKALVTGSQDTCVKWESVREEGFAFVDLAEVSKSGEAVCFSGSSSQRGFHLVLPRGSLEGGTYYKFRLVARNPVLGVNTATTVLQTYDWPDEGTCQITPESGVAMNTSFIMACEGFEAVEDLIFTLLYQTEAKEDFVYLDELLGSESDRMDVLLPSGMVQIMVKVCNYQEVCDEIYLDKAIAVTAMATNDDSVRSLGINVAQEIAQKEPLRALSLMRRFLISLASNGIAWNKYGGAVCSLHFGSFRQTSVEFVQALEPSDVHTVVTLLDLFVKSPCWGLKGDEDLAEDRKNAILAGKQLTDALKGLQSGKLELGPPTAHRRRREVQREKFRQFLARQTSKFPRLKRSNEDGGSAGQQSEILSFFEKLFTPQQMEVVLQFAEMTISGETEADIEAMRSLLSQVHGDSMRNLCRGTTPQSEPELLATPNLEVMVKRTEFNSDGTEKFTFGSDSANRLIMDKDVVQQFQQWECPAETGSSNVALPCFGLCVGTALYRKDYVTPTSQRFNVTKDPMRSEILDVRLLHPQSGVDLTQQFQNQGLGGSLELSIEVNDTHPPQDSSNRVKRSAPNSIGGNFELKCMVFVNDDWTTKFCETKDFVTRADGTATVDCDCSVPGLVAVFLVSSENVTVKTNEVVVYNETMTIRFDEDYNQVIGAVDKDKKTFLAAIRSQISGFLVTEPDNIQNLAAWAGSTVVEMNVVASEEEYKAELDKSFRDLVKKFLVGGVKMVDQKDRSLTLQPQCVASMCQVKDDPKDTTLFYIIVIVAAVIVVLVITLIIGAIIYKNQKRNEKIKPFMNTGSQAPTYRTFQFASSLEGTKANLGGAKKPTNIPPYLPSSENYDSMRRSQILEEQVSVDSGIQIEREYGAVPKDAARYQKPSRQDLAKTQPISDEIVKRVERKMTEKLPGTPEN